jgi:DNA-binding protein HU-beta/integration host factor subunit beta
MSNITKQDLITEISKNTGLTQSDVKLTVEEFLSVIGDTLVQDNSIEIRGFGTFLTKVRKPRPARNPKTGEIVPLLERTVPLFKFSTELKHRIDKGGKIMESSGERSEIQPEKSIPEQEIY